MVRLYPQTYSSFVSREFPTLVFSGRCRARVWKSDIEAIVDSDSEGNPLLTSFKQKLPVCKCPSENPFG
jgi:hypothetical protein